MNGKQNESNNPRKTKKSQEKTPAPSYRDYLDMDTDEEEFGRQETPEPDEELSIEPEKPVFSEKELATLVQYVKNLSNFFGVHDNFSDNSIDTIREFFCYPVHTVLTIVQENGESKALLDFPQHIHSGLTYFMRMPWQIYTPDNFMQTVVYGSLNNNIEKSLLKFFENIYAPEAFYSNKWPKVTRNEIFSNLNEFLRNLTNATYDPMGLAILYIPREGIQCLQEQTCDNKPLTNKTERSQSFSDGNNVNSFIERLERVASYWIKQIREVLKGSNLPARPIYRTIGEEINFWNFRFESLSCLRYQLSNKYILAIIEHLLKFKSARVEQFHSLVKEIDKLLTEIASDITYLNVFNGFDNDFQIPDGIDEYTKNMVHLIRFIGKESKFYGSTEKMEALCQALSTEVIVQCKKYIDLNIVLEGNPKDGKTMLENSINCCIKYQEVFLELKEVDKYLSFDTISTIDEKKIFCHVQTFMQRCSDLIEITESRIIFDESDEKMLIGGAKALEYEKQYKKIEKLFIEALNEVKNVQDCILDVTMFVWLKKMLEFRGKIFDIDNMIENLINMIFNDVTNVDEGVETLFSLKRFILRPHLGELLNRHWEIIWKIFEQEIDCMITNLEDEDDTFHPSMTPYAGAATLLRLKNNYLDRQYNVLINASDWFGDYVGQQTIIDKYKFVQNILLEKENKLFTRWEVTLCDDDELRAALNQPIIKYCNIPNEKCIIVNLNKSYLDDMRAINEWKGLDYEVKKISTKLLEKWSLLIQRYNQIDYLCKLHNKIISEWTEEESSLLEILLDDVKVVMTAGLPRITWLSEFIDKYHNECYKNICNLRDITLSFQQMNDKINMRLQNVEKFLLVQGTSDISYNLSEFEIYLQSSRNENLLKIEEISKEIVEFINDFKNKIQYNEQTLPSWETYKKKIVSEFELSLKKNIRKSLESALKFFHGDGLTHPEPLLFINTNYIVNDIIFDPSIEEVKRIFEQMIFLNTKEIVNNEILNEFFKLNKNYSKEEENFIELDGKIQELKNEIYDEVEMAMKTLDQFIKSTNILNDISNIKSTLEQLKQDVGDHKRNTLESEIVRCEELSKSIFFITDNINIHFLSINTTGMKTPLLEQCDLLKDMLFVELSRIIAAELALQR
ncbi:dynein-1-beta heavy chain, flagellar inner arm I1 complex [Chelonus insularis]|uniref:dynein-1-beta heavy chain, flagellar inner arm I1 complex n=1 Tax=Chelonus insularis TaxID=460826 RepID=UPI00158C0B47|nr:dynein-1-beta heavy chain, flagellar inner arm I1 complex [Chelonus insularis]